MIKRILALLFVFIIPFSIFGCDDDIPKISNKKKNQEQENLEKDEENKNILKYAKPYYNTESKNIVWDKVENAEEYEIKIYLINQTITKKTTETYFDVSNLSPGTFSVSIKPISSNKKYETGKEIKYEIKIPGFNQTLAREKVKEELRYSIVFIKITRYNTILGIKTDKQTEQIEGVICKKNNNTYWIATNSPLLQSNTKYDKTEIIIKDSYGNEYTGTKINPTNTSKNLISIIQFNSNIQLPTVNFAKDQAFTNEEIMLISNYEITNYAQFVYVTDFKKSTNNNIKTEYDIVITNRVNNSNFSVAVFNDEYQLIGISININNNKFCYIQIREILEYIDKELANKTGYAAEAIIPVDVKPPSFAY